MGVKNLDNWELKEPLVLCIAKNFKHKKTSSAKFLLF